MTNPRNQTLFAFLDATNSLFLSSQADYSNALGAKDPDVSFSPGNNSLTIIYCQRLSDGVPFADDPRIINQTGGGG